MFMKDFITIFDAISISMMVGIIVVYFLSFYWNLKLILVTEWQDYSFIKLYIAIAEFVFTATYVCTLARVLLCIPIDVNFFGAVVIRPSILFLGGALASSARASYKSLVYGGERWILRRPEK